MIGKHRFQATLVTLSLIITGAVLAETPKSEGLAAALATLESLEKTLPAERAPTASMGQAERENRAQAFFLAGRACHDIMEKYAEPLVKKADKYLRASLAYRESPVTRVYLGSAHLIRARDVSSVITKISEVDIGLKEVDAAVKAAPNDILVRAIRVECTIGLPSMFKRLDIVTDDLGFMLRAYADSPKDLAAAYSPARVFELKAKELEQRGKGSMADKYREKAKELSKGEVK